MLVAGKPVKEELLRKLFLIIQRTSLFFRIQNSELQLSCFSFSIEHILQSHLFKHVSDTSFILFYLITAQYLSDVVESDEWKQNLQGTNLLL